MTATVLIILIILVLAVGLFIVRAVPGFRAYAQFRGKRLVTCPETKATAAVDVAAGEAAIGAFLSEPTVRLKECSRWPERASCGQDCLQQVEVDPDHCLVWKIVSNWYAGKKCIFCQKEIGPLHQLDHAPALLSPDFRTTEWKVIRPEQLPEIFATHQPVCWNCHVTESFRRLHPELVVNRAPEPKRLH